MLTLDVGDVAYLAVSTAIQELPHELAASFRTSYPDLSTARLGAINDPTHPAHGRVRNMATGGFYSRWHLNITDGPNVYLVSEVSEAEGLQSLEWRRRLRERGSVD